MNVRVWTAEPRGHMGLFPFLSRPNASTLLSHSFFKQVWKHSRVPKLLLLLTCGSSYPGPLAWG